MAGKVITDFIKMSLFKRGGAIANDKAVQFSANALEKRLVNLGIDPNSINNQTQLKQLLAYVKQMEDAAFDQQFSGIMKNQKLFKKEGDVIPFKPKRSFAEEIDAMKKSGDLVDEDNMVISDKITEREMFKNSNLNKSTAEETIMDRIIKANNRITQIKKEQAEMYRPKTDAEIKAKFDKQNQESIQKFKDKMKKDEPEDKADGGRIGFKAGKFVLDKIIAKLLGNKNKIKQAADDIFPTGDYKYDAQMAAEALVENNPKIFKNKLYDDLDTRTQIEIYGAVLEPIQKNMAIARQLKKASRPEKTLESMKKGEGIDMSNPDIADEFTRFMKETDPQGSKTIEQTVELANFDPKGRKKNATGGRAGFDNGGISGLRSDPEVAKKINELINQKQITELIKQQPDGILMDPPPRPNYELIEEMLNPKDKGLLPNNTIEFDDGTIFFKDSGEYYKQDGTQVDGPSKNAKVKPITMEAAKGGRAGFYTGGITDVEPSLDDIGHGSDSLMARTRLMSPGSQTTTSTGLNYLLAEDNDNMRVPFSAGGDPRRRAFLKLLAALGGGIAGLKSGLLGMGGKETVKKSVAETVKQSAGSGMPPPYFFKLVKKIKEMGNDTIPTNERTIAKSLKSKDGKSDYILEEDQVTGDTIIKKVNKEGDEMITDVDIMEYRMGEPVKGKDGKVKTTPNEYEEVTESNARIEGDVFNDPYYSDGIQETEIKKIIDEVSDVVLEDIPAKADGGRIGYNIGGLSKLGITGSSRRFLEKVFGKEKFARMIENDPELHRGMLEVVEMFRKKDKEGLKMYLQKFLPHMDDAEIEDFIVGSGGTEGIEGQLIRLGSGRDYQGKLEMMKEADNVRKLDALDVTDDMIRKPNFQGGRIGFSGGGIFRTIIAKAAAAKGMKPYEFIKVTSYKSLPREVKMFMSADDFAKLKSGQEQMYNNYIDMMKTRKNFQQEVEAGKKTPASTIFEHLEKTMDKQSYVPKTVTADDIAEAELMVKNRFQKGRKDNALGGLQTMLGE